MNLHRIEHLHMQISIKIVQIVHIYAYEGVKYCLRGSLNTLIELKHNFNYGI